MIKVYGQGFFEWMTDRKLSDKTIRDYLYWLTSYKKLSGGRIREHFILEFLRKHPNNVAKAMMKSYLEFRDIDIKLPKAKGRREKKLPRRITEEEMFRLRDAMGNRRNKLLVEISFYCGLRLKELINLEVWDFNWEEWQQDTSQVGEVKVRSENAKGGRERVVFVPSKLMLKVNKFIKKYHRQKTIFNIKENTWQKYLYDVSGNVLSERISPHVLRHSYATDILEKNIPLLDVQDSLGHTSLATTQIYLHLDKRKSKERFNKLNSETISKPIPSEETEKKSSAESSWSPL